MSRFTLVCPKCGSDSVLFVPESTHSSSPWRCYSCGRTGKKSFFLSGSFSYRSCQVHCLGCGSALFHSRRGRPKQFCSSSCRSAYRSAWRAWCSACVDEALAGRPEPPRDFGFPVEIGTFALFADGRQVRRVFGGSS